MSDAEYPSDADAGEGTVGETDSERAIALAEDATRKADRALNRVVTLREENRDLRDRLDAAEAERDALRQEVKQLRQRTNLLEVLRDTGSMTVEERAAICIQSLYNEAYRERQKDTKDAATASMDYKKAEGVFRGQITRDQIYRTFDRAAELIDDEAVVKYIEEARSAPKNSRLVLSLERGDVPPSIAGHEIEAPEV